MKTYIYMAKSGPGKDVQGELQAESSASAAASIDAMGYVPVWVKEKQPAAGGAVKSILGQRVSFRDVTFFTRQLASLTKSGVPILKALSTIEEQTENPKFAGVVRDIEGIVRDGNMLSGALKRYPALFSNLYVSMVRAGESGGVLDNVLFRLAEARECEEDLKRKVQSAIAYPLLIVAVGILTVIVLLTFFLPKIVVLFRDYNDLPLPTRMIMGLSDFFVSSWYWLVMIVVLMCIIFKKMAAMEKGRLFVDRIKLRSPLIGRFILLSDISRFARTLALLIDAGISIDKALDLSADTLNNSILREEIKTVGVQTVNDGASVSAGLKKTEYFPSLISNMTAVGEEAGRMDESLMEVADFYDKEIDLLSKMATSLIEPILILVVGLLVGFIVAAMLLPIFQLGTSL